MTASRARLLIERYAAAGFAAIGVFALIAQWRLLVDATSGQMSMLEATVRFVSYFTIEANILVVLVLAAFALRGRNWLVHPFVRTAVATYITVVGLVYVIVLRPLWSPQGVQWVVDALLHYVMPLAYIAFWAEAVRKTGLRRVDPLLWLVYPLFYCAFVLIRGDLSGFYPYPFLDVARLGYRAVALNIFGTLGVFVVVGGAYVAAARLLRHRAAG